MALENETTEATTAAPPPPAAALPPADQTTTPPSLKDQLAEFGFENVADDSEAQSRLLAAYKDLKQKYDEVDGKIEEALSRVAPQPTVTQAQQQAASDQAQGWWNPPQVDTTLIAQYRQGDGWKQGTPESVIQQAAALEAYRQAWASKLVSDPKAALKQPFEELFNEFFEQRFGQLTAQQREAQLVEQTLAQNATWLYETDPLTKQPKPGVLSTEGQAFNQHFLARQEFIRKHYNVEPSFADCWEFAANAHKAAKLEAQLKTTLPPVEKPPVKPAAGLNRSGSLPMPGEDRQSQRNMHKRPGQRFIEIAQRNGVAVN